LLYNQSNTLMEKKFAGSIFHIWTLNAGMNWVLIHGDQLSVEEDQIYRELPWPQLENGNILASFYNQETKSQMYTFETDSPVSLTVRALLHAEKPLSEMESEYFVLQVRYILIQQSLKRHWQEHDAFLQGLNSLTSMLDLDQLLQNIMRNALIAIPVVNSGFFTLYDPKINKLVPTAAVCMSKSIYEFKTDIGEGIAGKVFQDETGHIYNPEESTEAISNLTEENYNNLMKSVGGIEAALHYITMAVPVRMNKDRLGVMVVHQTNKNKRKLNGEDLRRLQGFADQAAIAISNARLFSELRDTNEYLVKRNQIHEVFTSLTMNNADLTKIVQTVERLIGLPVFLYDLTKNEWCSRSENIPLELADTTLPDNWMNGVDPLEITVNKTSFHLYPIVNEGFPIGYFTVELRWPLQPLDTVVLEQGGALVALKMVNTYSTTDMYYKKIYEFYHELIQFRDPGLLMDKSREYGLSPEKPFFVVVLQLAEKGNDIPKRETLLRQLIASLNRELKFTDHLLFGFQDKAIIIIHITSEENRESVVKKIKTAGNLLKTGHSTILRGGIGRMYTGFEYVAKSAEEANKSLSYLVNRNIPGNLKYENIGINRLFINQHPKDIEQFIQEILSPLQTPKAKASDLELTLKTYIDTNRSIATTADQLHIHPNTLYHRLKKVEEALEVDLNDPNDWLTLLLACHLSETY
jgi:hypothetical protein